MEIAALVLGICSIVGSFFGLGAFVGIICGVIGLILSINCKKKGITTGKVKAGFICSIIGLILSTIFFISCVACAACASKAADDYNSQVNSILRDYNY